MLIYSKVPRPEKLASHVFEVDEDADKEEVRTISHDPLLCVCKYAVIIMWLYFKSSFAKIDKPIKNLKSCFYCDLIKQVQ